MEQLQTMVAASCREIYLMMKPYVTEPMHFIRADSHLDENGLEKLLPD